MSPSPKVAFRAHPREPVVADIRSILLHADDSTRWDERLRYAASIAAAFDADLTTLYAVDSVWAEHPLAMAQSPDAATILLQMQDRRLQEARAGYERVAESMSMRSRMHWKEARPLEPARAVTLHALAADLSILAQAEPVRSAERTTSRHLVESVVIDSGCPALVVPYIGAPAPTGDVALIAWKNTRESAQAVKAAIPFLKRARRVVLVTWREHDEPPVSDPDIAAYLSCHGIEPTLRSYRAASAQVGEAMLSIAAECSADLLVMGCYGHSRAREHVLGGATRSILDSMTIPVLMAH
jgi:nucleotide-binding universal stress UspA family protein